MGLLPAAAAPAGLTALARAAGLAPAVTGADLLAFKSGLALSGGACGLAAAIGAGRQMLVPGIVLAAACFLLPDLVLKRRVRARRERLALELPAMVDLLAVATQAGLPTGAALQQLADRVRGLLATELARAQRSIAFGSSRKTALRQMRDRCPHPGVAAMVAAVERSDRHGVSLAPALRQIARDAREERARAVRDHASRAAPKVQLAIALGLVPGTMLVVAAGLVVSLTS
jgi:tight adherence protein C